MIERVDSKAPDQRGYDESLLEELLRAQRQEMRETHAGKAPETLQPQRTAWRTPIRHALMASGRVPPMITNSNRLPIDRIPETDFVDDPESDARLVPDAPVPWYPQLLEDIEEARQRLFGLKR